ncbi:ORF2 [Pitorquevirus ursid7]|uniref:ORF2 n=1 Tax=Giant panda anellovirus TaxID=2016460 RepID=A0A220IGH3_9VIRU|nr:ORF2 [Giant panda anellovirus]ASH99080.1 ORF2 [Giant panda anellovirus]
MNPLSFHGRALIKFKKDQALWFKSCSLSHQLFCKCGDWQVHLLRYCERQRCRIAGDADGLGEGISFVTEDGGSQGNTGREPGGDTGAVEVR